MNEEISVKRLKAGDEAEFERLVQTCEKRVYNRALRYTNNEADAADIAQEVFLRVYRALPDFKEESAVTTWVYRITVNTAIDLTRKKTRRRENSLTGYGEDEETPELDIVDESFSPELEYEKAELRAALGHAIASLSEEHRKIIIMRDVNGMTYNEIGEILSLGEGTVKSRLFRARDRLRAVLEKQGNISPGFASNKKKGGNR